MTLLIRRPRARRRWAGLVGAVAVVTALAASAVLAVHDVGEFELDKNASNDTNVTRIGDLGANINATTTAIPVCQVAGAADPGAGAVILIQAERMTVSSVTAGSFGGNCAGTKKTYNVASRAGTGVAHQKGGVDGLVSLIVTQVKGGPDWNQVYHAIAGGNAKCVGVGDLVECAFIEDGIGPTTFIGGASKDHLPISGWQHTSGASPDKAEILNAYAAKALDEDGDEILYFGMDRYAVDGSTDIGFWFFRNEVTANANGTFTGEHQGTLNSNPADNDILALATFTQGGAATNIRVFRWVGSGGNESGTIQGPDADAGDCVQDPPLTNDKLCGTVNDTTIEVPWNYQFKGAAVGKWVPTGGMFEGGINLTELGLQGCFSSFLAETRSSPEITAVLKDFALGGFESCDTDLTTTPKNGTGGALTADTDDDALDEISIGSGSVQVKDSAVLEVKGISTFSGTLSFYLCGPIASGACDTGGVAAGSQAVTANGTYTSDAMTVTSVGRYCWYAEFDSATEGVPDASDGTTESLGPPKSTGECFEVMPVTPTIITNATAGPVVVGSSIDDTATLGGTATAPGTNGPSATYPSINATNGAAADGTITFTAYGPHANATTCTTSAYTSDISVSGNGNYKASDGDGGTFTPAAAGTYNWIASYGGDSPNTLSVSGACGDANESSVVSPKQPTISTNATAGPVPLGSSIDDVATLGGTALRPDGSAAGGTITFTAYGPHSDTTTCETVAYTSVVDVSGDGNYTASDGDGGTFTPTAAGTYNWIAVYSGDSPNTLGVSGACGDANESSVVISLQPTMDTAQRFVPNDAATVTVVSGGGDLAGSVVFKLYVNDADCSEAPAYTSSAIDITTGAGTGLSRTVLSNNTTAYTATGTTFHWVAEYTSTNSAHRNVTSGCGNEHSSITIDNGSTQPPTP